MYFHQSADKTLLYYLTSIGALILASHVTIATTLNDGPSTFTIGRVGTIRWETAQFYNSFITVFLTNDQMVRTIGTFQNTQGSVTWTAREGIVGNDEGNLFLYYWQTRPTGHINGPESIWGKWPVAIVTEDEPTATVTEVDGEVTITAEETIWRVTKAIVSATETSIASHGSTPTALVASSTSTSSTPQSTTLTPAIKSAPTGIILGSVFGGVALLGIICLAALYIWRWGPQRKRRSVHYSKNNKLNSGTLPPLASGVEIKMESGNDVAQIRSELPGDAPAEEVSKAQPVLGYIEEHGIGNGLAEYHGREMID